MNETKPLHPRRQEAKPAKSAAAGSDTGPTAMKWLPSALPARIPAAMRLLAVLLGGLHTWAAITSFSMNPDGISYLDIGDALMRGDWQTAVNPVWSPLYAWILGPVLALVGPTMRWEFAVVQLVNLVIYLAAMAAFEFLWRELWRWHRELAAADGREPMFHLPEWGWFGLGYALFIWSTLSLIEIWAVTPDMLMGVFVFLAAGLLVRLRRGDWRWRTLLALGAALGIGTLAKSPMLPLSAVFLAAALLAAPHPGRALPRVAAAGLVFLLFSAPYVAFISAAKGELTFGEAGKLTYVRHVSGIPYPHWQGEPAAFGVPAHPTRQIFASPPIYEFDGPIGGTYPVSLDPAYWYAGVAVPFDWGRQIGALLAAAFFYVDLFLRQQGGVLAAAGLLFAAGGLRRPAWRTIPRRWGLLLVALAAMGMYAPILVEGRYVGAFNLLLFGDLLANIRLPATTAARRLLHGGSLLMLLFMLVQIGAFNLAGFVDVVGPPAPAATAEAAAPPPSWPGAVAESLQAAGVVPGDRVGVIGYAFESFWARLARVRIIAEMFDWESAPYWTGDAGLRAAVEAAFVEAGARAIVAENVPAGANTAGWRQVEASSTYIFVPEGGR